MASELPLDAIFEILTRTSLNTLHACKATSKHLQNLSFESNFLEKFAQKTNTVFGYLFQTWRRCDRSYVNKFVPLPLPEQPQTATSSGNNNNNNNLPLDFLPSDAKLEATSHQGLCVFVRYYYNKQHVTRYYVCKPAMKEMVELPNPRTRYMTLKVMLTVVGSNPFHYKIVRFSWPNQTLPDYTRYCCEVFDSDVWAWKRMYILLPYTVLVSFQSQVLVSGSIYFLTDDNQVFEFDIDAERYTRFCIPWARVDDSGFCLKELVKYKDELGFVCKRRSSEGWFELWVMKKLEGRRVWEKRLDLELPFDKSPIEVHSDTVVVKDYDDLIYYNFKNGKSTKTKDLIADQREIMAFRSDL